MSKRSVSNFPTATAVHATELGALEDGASGAWVLLLPLGKFAGRDGRGPYDSGTAAHMAAIVEATKKRAGTTELVVDYDHQSVFSAVPGVGGLAPAAGWIKEFDVREDGLYGRVVWTTRAARAIRAGEYRYISPVYHHDKAGRVIRLVSAGLTNVPNLDLAAVAASATLNNPQEDDMDKIALALGLAQGAGEADILAAINSALTSVSAIAVTAGLDKAAKPADVTVAVAAMRAGIDKVATAAGLAAGAKADDIVTAVQTTISFDPTKYVPIAQVVALQSDINTLRTQVEGEGAEVAVNKAIGDGKLVPALKDWGLQLFKADRKGFDQFVGAAPVLTATQRATTAPPGNGDPALSETDLAVMSQLGISRDDYLKSLKGGAA